MDSYIPTSRTTLKRRPQRGHYDRETVHAILDATFICHVGFAIEGQPYVIPTSYGRDDDRIFIHGAAASRMLRLLAGEVPVCVTVTLLDGLVLARSAFHHSVNYRSVVIIGRAGLIEDPVEKAQALRVITNHIVPGRWEEARQPNDPELRATTVLELPLEEVSAKIRTGPPIDDEEDRLLPIWAGVVPMRQVAGIPEPDSLLDPGIEVPESIKRLSAKG